MELESGGGYIVAGLITPMELESGVGYIVAQYNHSSGIRHWGGYIVALYSLPWTRHRVKKHPSNYRWCACHILPLFGGGGGGGGGGENIVRGVNISYDIFPRGQNIGGWKYRITQALIKLCTTLRFFACGAYFDVVEDTMGLSQATVCVVVHQVTQSILRLIRRFVVWPAVEQ